MPEDQTEVRLASYMGRHSLPDSAIDHLYDKMRTSFGNSKIAEKVQMDKTKCSALKKNALAKVETYRLVEELRFTNFSPFVDEGSDMSTTKLLFCVVRYHSRSAETI